MTVRAFSLYFCAYSLSVDSVRTFLFGRWVRDKKEGEASSVSREDGSSVLQKGDLRGDRMSLFIIYQGMEVHDN